MAAIPAAAQAPVFNLPLKAKLTDCHTGPLATDRFAVFVGQMPALQRTRRMWMRFDLFERTAAGSWQPVLVPKFGTWQKSLPGKPGFIYLKRVDQLQAPAAYRAQVRLPLARRRTASCSARRAARRAPATSPTRAPTSRSARSPRRCAGAGKLRYVIRVRNDGRSDVGPFDTVLSVDGERAAAGDGRGPAGGRHHRSPSSRRAARPGSRIQIALDPAGTIDEARETQQRRLPGVPDGLSRPGYTK